MGARLTPARRTLTVDEFHRIGAAGVFREDDRIELMQGEMIEMAPIGSKHFAKLNRMARLMMRAVGDAAVVSIQNPISLPPHDEPQPDIALLKPRADDYETALPLAQDVLLVVEIADTTVSYDRDAKLPLYARYGIAEVWLIDLQSQTLTIHLDAAPTGYRRTLIAGHNDTLSPSLLPQVAIALADFWR